MNHNIWKQDQIETLTDENQKINCQIHLLKVEAKLTSVKISVTSQEVDQVKS